MCASEDQETFTLITVVDDKRRRTATKALDVSLNELADMYDARELRIDPEYQRLFRWSASKQSQLIESLILEMPIPPIFVIEEEEGRWELIDGLQRVSTYLHFRGMLDAPLVTPPIVKGMRLRLENCDIITELNDCVFDDLPTALQIRLKRSFFRVEVVRRETDPRFRYYMFKRLNTGGEALSPQEVRNCTIRLLGSEFNDLLISLSKDESFLLSISPLTEDSRRRMSEVELVLRFFAFHYDFDRFRHDVGPFLTAFMERVTDNAAKDHIKLDFEKGVDLFKRTFGLLARTLGESTCLRWIGNRYGGGFSNHHYEAFSLGVARVINSVDLEDTETIRKIGSALDEIKKAAGFQDMVKGGGQNSPGKYRDKIGFVEQGLRAAL